MTRSTPAFPHLAHPGRAAGGQVSSRVVAVFSKGYPGESVQDGDHLPRATGDEGEAFVRTEAVLNDRLDLLFARVGLSVVITTVVAVILVLSHPPLPEAGAKLYWLAAMMLSLALRGLTARYYHRRETGRVGNGTWLIAYRVGVVFTATAWGTAGLLFYPSPGQEAQQVVTLLVLAGVSAGALTTMTADFASYRNHVLLALAPICVLAFSFGTASQMSIGLLILLMAVFLLQSGKGMADTVLESFDLRYRNADLVDDLRREKNRLVNEAETMIGTVLSCAPIALWAIDERADITFIDGNRLGKETGLRLPHTGENLLKVFHAEPQILYETERALRGESFVTVLQLDDHSYEVHYSPFPGEDGTQRGAIGVAIDISERMQHEKELNHRAHYDQLTGLPNRTLILSQIDHAIEHARRKNNHVSVFFLDLDNFKGVNDSMGHKAGDQLLQRAAQRLQATLRESDIPARLSGDEFLVLSEDLLRPGDAKVVAHKIVDLFNRPFSVDNREIFVTASVGIAVYPQDGETPGELLKNADTAMYHAKSMGKNSYRFFTNEMQATAEKHLVIETHLRRALERNEMHLMFQPKIDIEKCAIQGAEVLLRWTSPELGVVPPGDFIAVAEYAGLMQAIGTWVLQQACTEAALWQGLRADPVQVAINVSPQQFRSIDLLANVERSLAESSLPPALLELEITESVMVQDAPNTLRIFDDLHRLGVSLSLDDFGTGYSSLSYLKKFPLQVLKIDKAFVQDLGNGQDDGTLVDAIIAMAKSLRMQIVAEGVETPAQMHHLRDRGVDLVQGYYFSEPVDAASFRRMLDGTDNAWRSSLAPETHRAADARAG